MSDTDKANHIRKKRTAAIVMTKYDVTMANTNLHGKVGEKETHCYDSHDEDNR